MLTTRRQAIILVHMDDKPNVEGRAMETSDMRSIDFSYPESWEEVRDFPWGPWTVTVGYCEINGRMEPVGLLIQDKDPERLDQRHEKLYILTAAKIRTLPFGEYVQQGRAILARAYRGSAGWAKQRDAPNIAEKQEAVARLFEARPGRPPRLGTEHYRKVAEVYSAAWLESGSPTKAVAKKFHVAHSTAAKWVGKARDLGILENTSRGKASGLIPGNDDQTAKGG